ncbi:MAG: hypothetical protein INQ03_13960 [Candidatus Heimdallarchaeota archaeon]|nr:hypothetical protein [Candidatus Heimdallarchaeota archaeon]
MVEIFSIVAYVLIIIQFIIISAGIIVFNSRKGKIKGLLIVLLNLVLIINLNYLIRISVNGFLFLLFIIFSILGGGVIIAQIRTWGPDRESQDSFDLTDGYKGRKVTQIVDEMRKEDDDSSFDNIFDRTQSSVFESKSEKQTSPASIPAREKHSGINREKFEKILRRYTSIEISELASLLETDKKTLQNWLLDLPDEYAFKINNNMVELGEGILDAHIDDLFQSFEEAERTGKGKI